MKLPGEPCTAQPIPCAPFPDRLSAYVWRNWNLVPPRDVLGKALSCRQVVDAFSAAEMPL